MKLPSIGLFSNRTDFASAATEQGHALLEAICGFVRRFVLLSETQLWVIATWVVHTHALIAAETTPYLAITSAEKQSGKTRLLETLELLVNNPWFTGRVTAASLVRKIDAQIESTAAWIEPHFYVASLSIERNRASVNSRVYLFDTGNSSRRQELEQRLPVERRTERQPQAKPCAGTGFGVRLAVTTPGRGGAQLRRSARKEDLDRARELIGHPRRRDGIGADSFRQQAFAFERAQQPGSIERSLAQLLRLRVVGGKQAEICTKIDVEPFPPTAKRRKVVRARGDDRLLRIFRGALEFTRLIALE